MTVAASLLPVAASVRVVELPGLPEKGDVTDWVEAGGAKEQLEALVSARPALDEAKLAELRNRWGGLHSELPILPPMTREEAARITAELLETCRGWIRKYVVVSDQQAMIMAAWILHTYALDAAETTPYIHITAPERECGKSRLMETLEALAAAPIRSGGMTAAALVRAIEAKKPTIFLDELDAQLGGDKEYAEVVRGILNEGFHRRGVVHKCVGQNFDLKAFGVYCPKCFAGIGRLPDTVASRSMVIEMRRRLPSESVEPFRQKAVTAAALPIKRKLGAWAAQRAARLLETIQPAAIAGLSDRQNDISEPLLCIAQLAGDGGLQKLTLALQIVFKAAAAEDGSVGSTLLADIRAIFDGGPSGLMERK